MYTYICISFLCHAVLITVALQYSVKPARVIPPVGSFLQFALEILCICGSIEILGLQFQFYEKSHGYLIVDVQSLSHVQLFATPWATACQASPFFTTSRSLLKLMSTELAMQSIHLISVTLFSSCCQYFLASGSFPMSRLFASGGQNIGTSASVLPINIQGLFPLGFIGLSSLQSKGLLQHHSSTAFSLLYGPTHIRT